MAEAPTWRRQRRANLSGVVSAAFHPGGRDRSPLWGVRRFEDSDCAGDAI